MWGAGTEAASRKRHNFASLPNTRFVARYFAVCY
jgi:hypothetical protein